MARRTLVPAVAAATALLGLVLPAAAAPGHGADAGTSSWVLSTTDATDDYAPTFIGNGYFAARIPAAGEGYSSNPTVTQAELAGFYAQPDGSYERRASLPTWTTLGFGAAGAVYGVPGNWSCAFDMICPAMYGNIFGGAFVERSHPGSVVGGYLAGLNTNLTPTVGGTDIIPIREAPGGPATLNIRYANGTSVPQTVHLGVNGALQQITVPPTGSWNDWAVLSVPVTLRGGHNIVEITVTSSDTARVNVDYVALFPDGDTPPTGVASATMGQRSNYRQTLDMRTGTVSTSFDWTSPSGQRTSFSYSVNANRAIGHLGTVHVTVVPHWSGPAVAVDDFDPQGLDNATVTRTAVDTGRGVLSQTVTSTGDLVTAALSSVLRVNGMPVTTTADAGPDGSTIGQRATFTVHAGRHYHITKFVGVASSVDTDRDLTVDTPQRAAKHAASGAARAGYQHVIGQNDQAWAGLWRSSISVPGDTELTARIHAAMFYLLESMRRGVTWSTSPGGLSSDGYNGHVFWDTETWMYPSLLAQYPDIAVTANTYRQKLLPAAEAAAAALSTPQHPIAGAKFPWESALTGAEAIPPGYPEGRDEIHIDSNIALAQWQYFQASGDTSWLRNKAWPVLKAIADYWATRAVPGPSGGYVINDVQGADEYHDGVDNSASTNAGARASLHFAMRAAAILHLPANPAWRTVADGVTIPFDSALGIHPEYDGYAGQTVKQADVTLLQYPWGVQMPPSVAQQDLDYYARRTDPNGPSMTDAIASIDSSALNSSGCSSYTYMLRSVDPFIAAPFEQFHETRNGGAFTFTTGEGGFLQEFLYGFTGLRWGTEAITVDPSLPSQLPGVDVTGLKWHGRTFDIAVGQHRTKIRLRSGAPLPVRVGSGPVRYVHHTWNIPTRHPASTPTTDIARCAAVTATSADPSYPAVAAVDGTDGTWWQADKPGAALTVDLGRPRWISEINVHSPSSTTPYTIQVSLKGHRWTTVVTQDSYASPITTHTLPRRVHARFVRYLSAAGSTGAVSELTISDQRPSGDTPPAFPPQIDDVSPSSAGAGATVTITGEHFGDTQGSSYVTFSDDGTNWGQPGDAASFTIGTWSDSAIQFTVPLPSGGGAWHVTPGTTATVTVTTAHGTTAAAPIEITG